MGERSDQRLERLYGQWMRSLELKKLTPTSISIYEQCFRAFVSFLNSKEVTITNFRAKHVTEFIRDQYQRGNSQETVIHYVDCIRQFFSYHEGALTKKAAWFSLHHVRKSFDRYMKSQLPIEGRPGNGLNGVRQSIRPARLKDAHSKFHPRG